MLVDVYHHVEAREQVRKELAAAGVTQVESHDFLPERYFLVFRAGKG